jgi:phenylacetic acid degradation operon negative regulatory protein
MTDPLRPLLDKYLHGEGRLRVWSLIVTILGDAVEIRDKIIPSARLAAILDRLEVSSAAQRTALSRLVKDGWMDREKLGRNTFYSFSKRGHAEFIPASRLVYAPPRDPDDCGWVMAASDAPRGYMVAPGLQVWPADAAPDVVGVSVTGSLSIASNAHPDPQISDQHQVEAEALAHLLDAMNNGFMAADELDALAARIILIHRWRRYVLRFPEVPKAAYSGRWVGQGLRARVAVTYWDLSDPADTWLQRPTDRFGALSKPFERYFDRFKKRS